MPAPPGHVARRLADHGYSADREAVEILAAASDPGEAIELTLAAVDDEAFAVSGEDVRASLDGTPVSPGNSTRSNQQRESRSGRETRGIEEPASGPVGTARTDRESAATTGASKEAAPGDPGTGRPGTELDPTRNGTEPARAEADDVPSTGASARDSAGGGTAVAGGARDPPAPAVDGDVTGHSTCTGEYGDFVRLFRDRYDRLARQLRPRVNHRPTNSVASMAGGSDAAIVGMVSDIRSTANGHHLVELEDTNGTFPCLVVKDREFAGVVDELLLDEVVAVEGTLADDAGILFADSVHFPDVPRTFRPSTADRHVQAALVSDVHVGSQEFMADAWESFASWLHTEEAAAVEYLLIAGDMVEGVGVYPDQDDELDVVDIYDQYESFSERLKAVPGDLEIVMIPGNHDAVRLAEPQPAFDDELRTIMSAHDARVTGNPSSVTLEGVSILLYHGVSLDEVIAEIPAASYGEPQEAMSYLLKKRHLAPQYGSHVRVAPEERDYLVLDEVPDVFHAGHVHKLGVGRYHNVTVVNSGCWQAQTAFQRANNIDPDAGFAPILDLDTLDVTIRKFA